jgi:uncharacterized protein involved in type VI secretion and phage assembly
MMNVAAEKKRYHGKYRGTVLLNVDPQKKGRILVEVPDVLGVGLSSWAMPCMSMAGMQAGVFMVPAMRSGVWVEFEGGDSDKPIWVGGYWGNGAEVPALAQATPPALGVFVVQTQNQNTLMLSDTPGPTGGFMIKTTSLGMITINDTGIIISNGKGASISMVGPTVTINAGALVIT